MTRLDSFGLVMTIMPRAPSPRMVLRSATDAVAPTADLTCVVSAEPAEGLAPKNKREAWRTSGKGVAALMLPQIPGRADLRLACKAEVTGEVRVETSPDLGLAWKRHPYYSGRSVNSWET